MIGWWAIMIVITILCIIVRGIDNDIAMFGLLALNLGEPKARWNGCDWSIHLDNINGLENHVNKIIVIEWPCLTIHICLLKRPQWWSISLLFFCFAWYRSATTADSLYEEEHLGTPSPQWYLLSFWYKFPAVQRSVKMQCN